MTARNSQDPSPKHKKKNRRRRGRKGIAARLNSVEDEDGGKKDGKDGKGKRRNRSEDSDNDGSKCKVSHYTDDPGENDGYTTTADGSPLDYKRNIVAVPIGVWDKYKGKSVVIDGRSYEVRDSCSNCAAKGISFDILVKDKKTADRLGVPTVTCSWKP